jgi:DNA polymerase I-like protein with 3'-5' exonuclease and polymerase domains
VSGLTEIGGDIPADCDYTLITTEEQLDELCSRMATAKMLAVDTETEGLSYNDIIVGVCISVAPHHGAYIPLRHEEETVEGFSQRYSYQLDPTYVFSRLKPILESVPSTGHNVKFDKKAFRKEGINCNFVDDTLIIAHLLGNYNQGERSLEELVFRHFGYRMIKLASLFPPPPGRRKKPDIRPKFLSPYDILRYGCEDGDYSLRLLDYLKPKLLKRSKKVNMLYGMEMQLTDIVADMELRGVPTSKDFLRTKSDEADKFMMRLEREVVTAIREQVGQDDLEINLNSPKQLGIIMYDYLGLPCRHLSKQGARSVAGHVLEEFAKEHPLMERILTYRLMVKLRGSFLEKMWNRVYDDERIRGNFNQCGTASGRFSSSDPNLQNIPKDQTFNLWHADDANDAVEAFPDTLKFNEEENVWQAYSDDAGMWGDYYLGKAESGIEYSVKHGEIWQAWQSKTRGFLAAPKNSYLIEADYSQVELRIVAGESQEPTLLTAFREGDDVHKKTAAVLFGVPFENVTKEQRSIGKTINFGLLYGAGPARVGQELNVSTQEAKDIQNQYFQNLPLIKSWINRMKADARTDGYASTSFERVRFFPHIKSSDQGTQAREEREAVNHHIQGAAADILKIALVRLHKNLRKYFGDKVRLVCTVHDSVLVECEDSCDLQQVCAVMKHAMEFDISKHGRDFMHYPPLEVDISAGLSWADTSKVKVGGDVELPEIIDVSTLPLLRNRLLGCERENISQYEAVATEIIDIDDIEVEPELTVSESLTIDLETGEVLSEPESDGTIYEWILEAKHIPSRAQIPKLQEFLKSKTENGNSFLTLEYTDVDGEKKSHRLSYKLNLSLNDELALRLIVGPCRLRQDLENLDPYAVLEGLSLGTE